MAQGLLNTTKRLILVGGSAGSLEALLKILPGLDAGLTVPIVLVLHRKYSGDNVLVSLLEARTKLRVKEIDDKECLSNGTLYVVPADYHVLFEQDHSFALDASEKVNFSRPSIDVVFQSAAEVYGSHLVCILLSGANADGTEGMKTVLEKGGVTIAQTPDSAEVAYMPEHAIEHHSAAHIFTPEQILAFLNEWGSNAAI